MPSSELDLAAIEKRVNAASPAPWSADPTGTVCADVDLRSDARGETVLPQAGPMEVAECYRSESPGERGKNAAFIAHARTDVPALLTKVAELQGRVDELTGQVAGRDERLAVVEKFVAERAQYITAINNIAPDAEHDYWRWQGHAESRRQLSVQLGLPVAWPPEYEKRSGDPADDGSQR